MIVSGKVSVAFNLISRSLSIWLNQINHQQLTGLDLKRNNSLRNPVAGSDVTLICRAYVFTSPPTWGYYQTTNDTEELIYINESDPPSSFGV